MIKFITTHNPEVTVEDMMEIVNDYALYGKLPDFNYEQKKHLLESAEKAYIENMSLAHGCYTIQSYKPIITVGRFSKLKILIKKVIRKCIYWYIADIVDQQTNFNAYMLRTIQAEKKMLDVMKEDYLKKAEQEDEKNNLSDEWYVDFENRFRGDSAVIKERLQKYSHLFLGMTNVIDLGCGRGEFLSILKENGVKAKGVDLNSTMVEECKAKGLDVYEEDVLHFLEQQEDGSVDGIFSSQLVEHIGAGNVERLLELAYQKLMPDGVCVIETVNPLSLGIFCYGFYIDPTHSCPVHPATLRFMAQRVGFQTDDIHFINEFPEEYHFKITEDMSEGAKACMKKMDEQMFGAQDYYIVCRKKVNNDK